VTALPVVLATRNAGKAREFARLLGPAFALRPLPPDAPLPAETGRTFAENAALKARVVASALQEEVAVLADDSGLEVTALGGAPGVRSARFAGEGATDAANVEKLLSALGDTDQRAARFVCALALWLPGRTSGEARPALSARLVTAEGVLEGEITRTPAGSNGFGYDPIFRPRGWEQTLAQGRPEDKDRVSHRAAAAASLRDRLGRQGLLSGVCGGHR